MPLLLDPSFLQNSEIGQFILPFLLMFAMTYGVLNYAKPFGEQKSVNALLAAVIGLFAASSQDFVSFFWNNLNLILVIFVILFIILVAKKLSEEDEKNKGKDKSGVAVIAGAIILLIAAKGDQIMDGALGLDRNSVIFLAMIVLFVILILAKGSGKSGE